MITKGIIEEIISPYKAKVRLPIFDGIEGSQTALSAKDLSAATICTLPNLTSVVSVGDIVYVGFEDDDIARPIILGHLSKESGTDTKAILTLDGLNVEGITKLSEQTNIGKVKPTEIARLTGVKANVQDQLNNLSQYTPLLNELEINTRNLLVLEDFNLTSAGITIQTSFADQSFSISGRNESMFEFTAEVPIKPIQLTKNTEYLFSLQNISNAISNVSFDLRNDESSIYIRQDEPYTPANDTIIDTLHVTVFGTRQVYSTLYMMLEQGSILHSWVKPGGLVYSTDARLQNVAHTTDPEIVFAESERLKTLNLFNPYSTKTFSHLLKSHTISDNTIKVISSGNHNNTRLQYTVLDLNDYLGQTLYFKTKCSTSGNHTGSISIRYTTYDGSIVGGQIVGKNFTGTTDLSLNFNVPNIIDSDEHYLAIYFYASTEKSSADSYTTYSDIMLSLSDISYIPYNGGNIVHEGDKGLVLAKQLYSDSKNLCYLFDVSNTNAGLTFTYDSASQVVTINGECTADADYFAGLRNIAPVISNKNGYTYTITFEYISGSISNNVLIDYANAYLSSRDTGSVWDNEYHLTSVLNNIYTNTNKKLISTITLNTSATYDTLRYFFKRGTIANNFKFKVQIEEGDHSSSWAYPKITGMQKYTYIQSGTSDINNDLSKYNSTTCIPTMATVTSMYKGIDTFINQYFASFDDVCTWIKDVAPIGCYQKLISVNGNIWGFMIQKASNAYGSFIRFNYTGPAIKYRRFYNGAWSTEGEVDIV